MNGITENIPDSNCRDTCPLYNFFRNSSESVFITSREGLFITVNESFEKLLGYDRGELAVKDVNVIYDSDSDRRKYQEYIEKNGTVHNYQITLKKKDGTPLFALVDAVLWKEDEAILGYHGIIKTRDDIVSSFHKYFLQLKEEKQKLREERRKFITDSMVIMNYMSDDLISYIDKTGNNPLVSALKIVTILFFDIRQSTGIAEKLESEIFASFLSDIFTDIMDLIYGNNGSVNKMIGDGIMATFGCPIEHGNDVQNAVTTAVQIRDYLRTFNDVRPEYLDEPLKAGIGIATGTVFAGIIGSVRRQEYTVLGDAVNIANRLEGLTKKTGDSIIIDEATYKEVKDIYPCKKISRVSLRGRKGEIQVFAL